MNLVEKMIESVPGEIKECIASHQTHEVVEDITGLGDFSLDKIAEYLGGMMTARRNKWRPVAQGLKALAELRKG